MPFFYVKRMAVIFFIKLKVKPLRKILILELVSNLLAGSQRVSCDMGWVSVCHNGYSYLGGYECWGNRF
jgi:hypothetical protein